MKKALSIILSVLMVMTIIPFSAFTVFAVEGTYGDNVTWTFDESTGTLTFSGTGAMEPFVASYGVPWNGHIDSIESVVISEGVTTIGDKVFYNHKNIKNVSIADSVTAIDDEAFYNCTGLTDVVIGKGVTTIGDNAFYECSNLKTVTIYNAVETIGEYSFNCPKLTDVYYFGTEAEWNAITKATILSKTGLENATIHFLGEEVHECSYNAVVTPPTCTEQGYTTYTCGCGDSYVDDYVDALGHIDNDNNNCCDKCSKYILPPSGPCGNNLTWTFDESTGTLTISGTGEMYDDIHRYYPSWHGYISSIESVVISQGVTTIGDSTFCNNENIKNVSIADSVTDIGDEAFYNCTDLTNVVIGDGVTTIGYRAFYNCDGLTDVVIGKGVTVIDDYAFNACSKLKTVTIYNAVETIGENSFNCPKLTDVYYFGTEAEWNAISKGSIIYGIITGTGLEKATIHFLGEETHECSYNAVVTAPTCTEQGYTTYTCECGDSYVDDYVDALGHNHTSEITTPATHTETGVMTYTCACGDTYTEVIEKLEKHNYEAVVTAPTCTEQGYTTYTCVCGDTYVDDYVNALGHIDNDNNNCCDKCSKYILPTSDTCGENATWVYDEETFTLTISGTGSMSSYAYYGAVTPWEDYIKKIKTIVIEEGIEKIGESAFSGCTALTHVSFPETLTTIYKFAFLGCTALKTVTIPKNITEFYKAPFEFLETVYYEGSFVDWCNINFHDEASNRLSCGDLYIDGELLAGDLVFPEEVTKIKDRAFANCHNITSVYIGEHIETIGSYAFTNCDSLKTAVIEGTDALGANMFDACSSLETVSIGEGTTWISSRAFYSCIELKSVEIPRSIEYIGNETFKNCTKLTDVYYGGTQSEWEQVSIDETNDSLETATIHVNVFDPIMEYKVLDENEKTIEISNYVGEETEIVVPQTIDGYTVVQIGENAFDITPTVKKVVLPETIKSIKKSAFINCKNLSDVNLPTGLTEIGEGAFASCAIESVTIPDGVEVIGRFAYGNNTETLKSVKLGSGTKVIGDYAFCDNSSLLRVVLPEGLISIGEHAFSRCGLISVNMPDSLETIGEYAFYECSMLSLDFGNSLTKIEASAFSGCENIISVSFNDGLVEIGGGAFSGCYGIRKIEIPESVTNLGEHIFSYCTKLKEVTINAEVSNISEGLFSECQKLESVTLPASVTTIEDYAFHHCNNLSDVYFCGTQSQWDAVTIGTYNEFLLGATIHCHSHNYNKIVTAPTCTEQGYTTHTCECGDSYVDNYVDATGHTVSNWIVDFQPTYTSNGSKHKECTVCFTVLETGTIEKLYYVSKTYTGLHKVDGVWCYIKNGELDNTFTGLTKHTNGVWYYVQNGQVNWSKTGLVKHTNGIWYYVQKGEINWSKTGLVKHTNGIWYYIQKGEINWSKTGLVKHTNGIWYYVQKGEINWSKTGLVKHTNGIWYYVQKGEINWNYTGLVKQPANGKWYYVQNGQVNWNYTGTVTYNGKKYKVVKGVKV